MSTPVEDENAVHIRIAEFAKALFQSDADSGSVIAELTNYAVSVVPGAQCAGISVARGKRIETPASTSEHPIVLDVIQQRHHEGPCLSAILDGRLYDVEDLENETRWPRYRSDAIRETPIRSVMSFELFARSTSMGALNVYADHPHAFDEKAHAIGTIIATHTAFTWDSVRSHEQFASALASRDIIGQAKGMVMERFDIDAARAFELLKKLSQDSNVGVAELARRLVTTDHPLPPRH